MATIEQTTNGAISLETASNQIAYGMRMAVSPNVVRTYPDNFSRTYVLTGTTVQAERELISAAQYAFSNGFVNPSQTDSRTLRATISIHHFTTGIEINRFSAVISQVTNVTGVTTSILGNAVPAIYVNVGSDFNERTGSYLGLYETNYNGPSVLWKIVVGTDCINLNSDCVAIPNLPGVSAGTSILGINLTTGRIEARNDFVASDSNIDVIGRNSASATITANNVRSFLFDFNDFEVASIPGLLRASIKTAPWDISGRQYTGASLTDFPTTIGNGTTFRPETMEFSEDFLIRQTSTASSNKELFIELNRGSDYNRFSRIDYFNFGRENSPLAFSRGLETISWGDNITGSVVQNIAPIGGGAPGTDDFAMRVDVDIPAIAARQFNVATQAASQDITGRVTNLTFDDRHFTITDPAGNGDLRITGVASGGTLEVQDSGAEESNPVDIINFRNGLIVTPTTVGNPANSPSAIIDLGIQARFFDEDGVETIADATGALLPTINFDTADFTSFDTAVNPSGDIIKLQSNVSRIFSEAFTTIETNAGSGVFRHTASHNLGNSFPITQVYSGTNVVIPEQITSIDNNTIRIEFPAAITGQITITG